MKILELEELLPRLDENLKDVDSWGDEFIRIMKLANITSPSSIHTWAMECTEGKLRGVLQELVTTDQEGNEVYPSFQEIKKALEDAMEITPQEKCKRLQKMVIQKGESIKNFNWRYKKLYNNLSKLYQTFITVDDYIDSIAYRPYARAQVITQRCEDLEEAFEEAELAERAEERRNKRNETNMTAVYTNQSSRLDKFINKNHPFKQFGINNHQQNDNINYYGKNSKANQKFKNNSVISKKPSKELKCFKCNQIGHVIRQCPYNYKELAEMEESGKLTTENNFLNY
jgi:DNA-binding transcriptional regulator GbsR (MarR family)